MPRVLRAYGLRVACSLPLPGALEAEGEEGDLVVSLAGSREALEAAWSGPHPEGLVANRWVDGRPLDYHRGSGGDTLLRWGDGDGGWLIRAGRTAVLGFSPQDPPDPAWLRVLLDSVLASVALGRGAEALHAGAVSIGGGAVAVLGGTGAGKTSLVAALLARGHPLVADDVLVLAGPREAWPAPPVISLDAARARNGALAGVGELIAHLGDEDWVHVARTADGPLPLRALVILDRRADAAAVELIGEPAPFRALFGHLLNSGGTAAREQARFAAVAGLAEAVPVLRLVAPLDGAGPEALAAVVETA